MSANVEQSSPVSIAPTAYFERLDARRFRATSAVQGAWNTAEQHIAPALGLIAHVLQQDHASRRGAGLELSRVSYDILGTLPIDVVEIDVRVLRPGRSIELVEAVLSHDGRPAVLARAWFQESRSTSQHQGSAFTPLAAQSQLEPWNPADVWPGEYVTTVQAHRAQVEPGRATFWLRPRLPLLAGEAVTDTARLLGVVDIANGVTPRVTPAAVVFPNLDVTAHLFRAPRGEWVGFDTTVSFGDTGLGLTHSVVHDQDGALGVVSQTLTVRPRS